MDYYDGKLDEKLYSRLFNETKQSIAELEEELASKKELREVNPGFKSLAELKKAIVEFTFGDDSIAGKTILRFVKRIVVNTDEEVGICYRFR